MKIEEAIKRLEEAIQNAKEFFDQGFLELQKEITEQEEVFKIAISTPHASSDVGESPAHIDRSKWEPCEFCGEFDTANNKMIPKNSKYAFYSGFWTCAQEGFDEQETEDVRYCPKCGRPLTEEAWIELEKRLRGNE